jgi:N-acetyltransferase
MSAMTLEAVVLENAFVRMEPFTEALREPVRAALDCDQEAWDGMVGCGRGPQFAGWWASAMAGMASGSRIPWAVRRKADDVVVGTTSLYEIRPEHRRCEMGSTFYRPDARGGVVNPACKRLALGHAFDGGAVRVEIVTDALNPRSRAAILKLGARDEGILRKHKVTWTGRVRDTAQFAILDDDWPAVRDRLDARLAGF